MRRERYFNSYSLKAFALVALMVGIFFVCGAPGYYCGDGILTPPEECDDGNMLDGDGCSANCTTEPEPEPCYCSPGYWKNHTEVWTEQDIGTPYGYSDGDLLCMLMPQCSHSRAAREEAAGILNNAFSDQCPCEECY